VHDKTFTTSRFGKYELTARLARGGMAETFRAQLVGAAGVTKQVVIKKVLPHLAQDEAFVEAFINEAKLSASLSHGNIAQVFDFGRVEGDYFIAMELVDGRSLAQMLQRAATMGFEKLPVSIACFLTMEVLKGLHYAHTRTGEGGQPLSLVHRDVSPENVLVSFEGQTKVVDFGVAKAAMRGRTETEPGLVKGKFLYFSPEQACAEPLDGRSDVFAVGVVLYRMLCGVLPFEGQMHNVMRAIVGGRFKPAAVVNPQLPSALAAVIAKAMAVERANRYASALEMQEALASFLYRQEPTFSGETVKEWMTWLFAPELEQQGRSWSLSSRFEQQLQKWDPQAVRTAPSVQAVTRVGRCGET
jgi:eukaryotic-like serine/threonine-protein kinase